MESDRSTGNSRENSSLLTPIFLTPAPASHSINERSRVERRFPADKPVVLIPGETATSFTRRVAEAAAVDLRWFCERVLQMPGSWSRIDPDLWLSRGLGAQKLAAFSGVSRQEIEATGDFDWVSCWNGAEKRFTGPVKFCPKCVKEGTALRSWRTPYTICCLCHQCWLVDRCICGGKPKHFQGLWGPAMAYWQEADAKCIDCGTEFVASPEAVPPNLLKLSSLLHSAVLRRDRTALVVCATRLVKWFSRGERYHKFVKHENNVPFAEEAAALGLLHGGSLANSFSSPREFRMLLGLPISP